jgi:hypothetical protein
MRTYIQNAPKQNATHGAYTPLFFENGVRYDNYSPYLTDTPYSPGSFSDSVHAVLCLNENDLSPIKTERPTLTEMEKCHSCFASYAHTVNLCSNRQQKAV